MNTINLDIKPNHHPSNFIHHTAIIGPNVKLGRLNYIGPYCIIGFPAEHRESWGSGEWGSVSIGDGNVFTGHVTIDASILAGATTIADGCFVMKHSHIGHDAVIGRNVTISCGAKIGGHAVIGDSSNIGLNAVIHQRKIIQPGCMIGMGAVVTNKLEIKPFQTYAGNPAKHIGPNKKYNYEGSSPDVKL